MRCPLQPMTTPSREVEQNKVHTLVSSGLRITQSSVSDPPKETIKAGNTVKKSILPKTAQLDLCISVGNGSCSKQKQL